MTALSKVSFCTAVYEPECGFKNFIEGYLTTSKMRALVIPIPPQVTAALGSDGAKLTVELEKPDIKGWETALKVATWILSLGILPLLALIVKITMRCCTSYKTVGDPATLVGRVMGGAAPGGLGLIGEMLPGLGRGPVMAAPALGGLLGGMNLGRGPMVAGPGLEMFPGGRFTDLPAGLAGRAMGGGMVQGPFAL